MHKVVWTILLCVWVIICAVATVFIFDTPRQWVIKTLQTKTLTRTASFVPAALSPVGMSASVAFSNTFAPNASTTSTTTQTAIYQYKLLDDVDTCTLNKLGSQGWRAVQFGGTILSAAGYSELCDRINVVDVLDWVLFERQIGGQ